MEESLTNKETFGELKVQRNKRVKPMSSTTASVQVEHDTIHVDCTQLFQRIARLLHLWVSHCPIINIDEAGLMRKTKKSVLFKMFNDVKEGNIHDSGQSMS